jgi:hypothetical protein
MPVEGKWLNEEHLLVHGKCNRASPESPVKCQKVGKRVPIHCQKQMKTADVYTLAILCCQVLNPLERDELVPSPKAETIACLTTGH